MRVVSHTRAESRGAHSTLHRYRRLHVQALPRLLSFAPTKRDMMLDVRSARFSASRKPRPPNAAVDEKLGDHESLRNNTDDEMPDSEAHEHAVVRLYQINGSGEAAHLLRPALPLMSRIRCNVIPRHVGAPLRSTNGCVAFATTP